jgi:hypothetical protein
MIESTRLKQGIVIPVIDFTLEAYSEIADILQSASESSSSPRAKVEEILTPYSDLNIVMSLKSEVLNVEKRGKELHPTAKFSLKGLQNLIRERLIEAPWPAEVPTRPAYIRQGKDEKAKGAGALMVAGCKEAQSARSRINNALVQYYRLPIFPSDIFRSSLVPGLQVAYGRKPDELEYLTQLVKAINEREPSILPTVLEPGEQLKLY